jgi:hypothetical protein
VRRVWASFLLCTGCFIGGLHKTLPAPPPTLTPEQRIKWFDALAGASELTTWTTTCQGASCSTSTAKKMTLGNGTVIDEPDDLSPLVAPESPTAQHIRASDLARHHGNQWMIAATSVVASALVLALATDHTDLFSDRTATVILGPALAFGLFGTYAGHDDYETSVRAAGAAYESYTKDLADHLQICVLNMQLVPCEYRVPEPVQPEPAPSNEHLPSGVVTRN